MEFLLFFIFSRYKSVIVFGNGKSFRKFSSQGKKIFFYKKFIFPKVRPPLLSQ